MAIPLKKEVPQEDECVLELKDVSLSFGEKKILENFSLRLPKRHKLSIVGESACGKSTLLKVIVGLIPPDSGEVLLFNQDISRLNLTKLERLRRRVGMQFQAGALFDSMDVGENLFLASYESVRDKLKTEKTATPSEIKAMLEKVGLEKASDLNPSSLSGGMKKRAAIARALIVKPELAIFDEPTAGLDPITSSSIIRLLNELSADLGASMLLATTDVAVANRFSKDIIILNHGKLYARGTLEDHLASHDPYIKNFLKRYTKVAVAN
ncbi:MAG: ATP-binding cassette domain-containing protein [Deltaproteobacteria bacterium]|nr:ATP-binding cassette domain-containing protein [Deltaproteobacteria bacterium]